MAGEINPQSFHEGTAAAASTIDAPVGGAAGNAQLNPFYYDKQAIIEVNKKAYIGALSGTRNQPKNMGKEVKKHLMIPLLDDRNINDQGIDAAGVVLDSTKWTAIDASGAIVGTAYADEAAAIVAAETGVGDGDGTVKQTSGNLYGSSKDIGTIGALTPVISETGGRVNRIGFTREVITGTIENYGYFYEFTKDDLDFDSDPKLYSHLYRESGKAMGEMTEKSLMIDLIGGAGIELFAGDNVSVAAIAATDIVDLADLRQMTKVLNANDCPMDTQIISGSRNIDTKVVANARYAYTSDDVVSHLEDMMNTVTGKHAWAYVEEYADGAKFSKSNTAKGEVGKILKTRFIEHPEMVIEENAGVLAIDVSPILYIGSGSFTQIGFQSSGTKSKFNIIVKKPGMEVADRQNPYGKVGFVSSEYWYGVLIERPDHIGIIWTATE